MNEKIAFILPIWLVPLLAWIPLCLLISRLTGWSTLSEYYRAMSDFVGDRWRFCSAQTRWSSHYGGCLTLGANAEGLYISVWPLFRAGHPSLLIPWEDVSVQQHRTFPWYRSMELRFRKAPTIPFRISERLWQKIEGVGKKYGHGIPAWPYV